MSLNLALLPTVLPPCFASRLLLYGAGNLVFHGPKEEVVPFFQSQGFYVPERKAVSDFLQEVTSKKDQKVSFVV